MSKKEEENKMALRKEDLNNKALLERKKRILEMTAKASDKNDKGLRRLSKN